MALCVNLKEYWFPMTSNTSAAPFNFNESLGDEPKINKNMISFTNSRAKDSNGLDAVFLKKYKGNFTTSVTDIINRLG